MSVIGAALIGWCGTKWPGWRPGPKPGPDPEPWWRNLLDGIVGAGAAVLVTNAVGAELSSAGFVGLAVVAFAAGSVAKEILGSVLGAAGR